MAQSEWERLHQTWQAILDELPRVSEAVSEKDEEFHETLARATGNQSLLQRLRSVDERLHFIRMTDITTAERVRNTCRQHLRLLECIAAKNVAGAREALQMNIRDGRQHVETAVKEALANAYLGQSKRALQPLNNKPNS
jgi:DNA-binding GntR family transcriptional regulator